MKYEIKFCAGCYLSNAMKLAKALLKKHSHDEKFTLKLVPGETGQFDVQQEKTGCRKVETCGLPASRDVEADPPHFARVRPNSSAEESCGC